MREALDIRFFGSRLVDGAATYHRRILRALAERGHRITFYEPDAHERQGHRDSPEPPWARVVVYPGDRVSAADEALAATAGCDVLVKASGTGAYDVHLEQQVLEVANPATLVVFWDVDAPATLERIAAQPADPFAPLIPAYDIVFTHGGGPPVVTRYCGLGARQCVPLYDAVDPATHFPAQPDPRFAGDLGLLGDPLPDREARTEELFLEAARRLPGQTFVLGGSGWDSKPLPPNVRAVGHVGPRDHNAFHASTRAVLNVEGDSMARFGHSPATQLFEAAGAGACLISDAFAGAERFLTPGREVLLAGDGAEVARLLQGLTPAAAREVGSRARARVLAEHTYAHRALEVEAALFALLDEREEPLLVGEGGTP